MVRINKKAIALLAVLFLIALFSGGIYIYGIFFIALFLVLVLYAGGRNIYKNLINIIWKSSDKVVVGEKINLAMEFYNSGIFPMPYCKVKPDISAKLLEDAQKGNIYSIMPGSKAVIEKEIICKHKGIYTIGNIEVEYGDILGIFNWKKTFKENITLCVYPRVFMLRSFEIPLRQNFGTVSVRDNAYEDFASLRDIRKYNTGDSFKRIHWKVTAHRGEFYVKNVELNATADLNIFMDLYSQSYTTPLAYDLEEKGAECAVSIIRYALSRHMSVKYMAKGEEFYNISGSDAGRFSEFLDVVAKSTASGDVPIYDILKREAQKLNLGATAVVITPNLDSQLIDTFFFLKSTGIDFTLIYLCEDNNSANENIQSLAQNGIKIYKVGLQDDIRQVLGGHYEK